MHNRLIWAGVMIALLLGLDACTAPGIGKSTLTSEPIATETAKTTATEALPENTPSVEPTETQPAHDGLAAYIGYDGNVWLVNRSGGTPLQITADAVPFSANSTEEPIRYCCMRWSSDGSLLSYMREVSVKAESGYNYQYSFILYNIDQHTGRPILEGQTLVGYDWKPGEHLIAYGQPVEMNYWVSREEVAAEYAQGIWALNADTGETRKLVSPEHGYTLLNPRWSSDGRYLAFEEVHIMEGRGDFAWYDFKTGQYHALEKIVGSFSWSPDGSQIAYDQLSYLAHGDERIWLASPSGEQETQFSPDMIQPWYAFAPAFSPEGSKIAYLVNQGNLEDSIFHLYIQEIKGGEPRDYGIFEQVWQINWTSDSRYVIFSSGPYGQQTVVEVNLDDGTVGRLAEGSEAIPQP